MTEPEQEKGRRKQKEDGRDEDEEDDEGGEGGEGTGDVPAGRKKRKHGPYSSEGWCWWCSAVLCVKHPVDGGLGGSMEQLKERRGKGRVATVAEGLLLTLCSARKQFGY